MGLQTTKLTDLIRDAARDAFADLRAAHPGEAFYAFALYTDDGLMTVMPAANSEQGFRRAAGDEDDPTELAHYRWATGEWAYEGEGAESAKFDAVHDLLNEPAGLYDGDDDAEADRQFRARGDQLIKCMIAALRQLDAEGCFGVGEEGRRVTVFVSISDSDAAQVIENKSADLLNPPEVAAAFAERYG